MVALCGKNRFADLRCQGRGGSLATLESLSPELKAQPSVGLNDLALLGLCLFGHYHIIIHSIFSEKELEKVTLIHSRHHPLLAFNSILRGQRRFARFY